MYGDVFFFVRELAYNILISHQNVDKTWANTETLDLNIIDKLIRYLDRHCLNRSNVCDNILWPHKYYCFMRL